MAQPLLSARRLFLQAAGAAGALLGSLARIAVAKAAVGAKAKSVILIFNCGAPSHIDLWDMKPEATDTVRGEFKPIATNVPGIQVSELMPRLAQRTDKLAIVRSLHHTQSSHNSGMYYSIVGRPYRIDNTLINPSPTDYPCFGTLVGWLAQRDGYTGAVPPYVITPEPHCDSKVYITPGQFGGCLGSKYDPFVLQADPNADDFKVHNLRLNDELTTERLGERSKLLGKLGTVTRSVPSETAAEYDLQRSKATELVTSGEAARAFDLSKEPTAIRERYGRHTWGQSHLLARRLIEHGTKFVTTVNGPSITWDTHLDNFGRLKNRLVPPMEQAFAALLDDLSERGLLDSTLVVWMGDFGRTPTINKDAGRDHWPQCYTVVLAGGGIRGGQTIGASDKIGAHPTENPITPADLHATIFRLLGYDPHSISYYTSDGRPTLVSDGQPIRELL
jgi:Protein of unknown function (DUF1501)